MTLILDPCKITSFFIFIQMVDVCALLIGGAKIQCSTDSVNIPHDVSQFEIRG